MPRVRSLDATARGYANSLSGWCGWARFGVIAVAALSAARRRDISDDEFCARVAAYVCLRRIKQPSETRPCRASSSIVVGSGRYRDDVVARLPVSMRANQIDTPGVRFRRHRWRLPGWAYECAPGTVSVSRDGRMACSIPPDLSAMRYERCLHSQQSWTSRPLAACAATKRWSLEPLNSGTAVGDRHERSSMP